MKRNRIETFLPLAISLLVLVLPCYSSFTETDLFPTDLGITIQEEDEFADQKQDVSRVLVFSFVVFVLFAGGIIFNRSPYFFSQTPFLVQENLILRC